MKVGDFVWAKRGREWVAARIGQVLASPSGMRRYLVSYVADGKLAWRTSEQVRTEGGAQ